MGRANVARAEVRYKARSGNDKLDLWRMEELPRPVSVAKVKRPISLASLWSRIFNIRVAASETRFEVP
jgi:hypothetical protein